MAAVAFAGLAVAAHRVPYFPADLVIERAVQSFDPAWLATLLGGVSWVGFPPQSDAVFGLIILGVFLLGRRWAAAAALFAAAGSAGSWFIFAPLVQRPRPSADLVHVALQIPYGGFPSGHATNLTAFFGFLFYLAHTLLPPSGRRALAELASAAMVAAVGWARILSGEHWPSDVLGGYLLGSLWLALSIALYRRGGRRVASAPTAGPVE